jgi:hypothetical protein
MYGRSTAAPHVRKTASAPTFDFSLRVSFRLSPIDCQPPLPLRLPRYFFTSLLHYFVDPVPLRHIAASRCPTRAHPQLPLSHSPLRHRPIGPSPLPARSAFKTKHIFRTSPTSLLPPLSQIPTIHFTSNVYVFQSGAAANVAPSLTCLKSAFSRWPGECSLPVQA